MERTSDSALFTSFSCKLRMELFHTKCDYNFIFLYSTQRASDKSTSSKRIVTVKRIRAGNSLFGFPSESLIFCPKMSEWAIRSKKLAIHSFALFWWATWAICSRLLIISSERCMQIAHGCSFLVTDLSDLLIFGDRPERFAHIAQRKWAIVSASLTSLTKKEEISQKKEHKRTQHSF